MYTCKKIQPVHPKGDQSWVLIGRTDVEAEIPIPWPLHMKSWLIGRLWSWERLRAGTVGGDRGWAGWMASPTWWTGVWVDSRNWSWTGRPGVLWFMGSQRVRHDWATSLSLFTFMHWRRKWQPTPVILPGESQGQGSLVGCRLWGRTELDTTEAT